MKKVSHNGTAKGILHIIRDPPENLYSSRVLNFPRNIPSCEREDCAGNSKLYKSKDFSGGFLRRISL